MKKIIVLVAVMTLFAGSAFAQISATKHNLSSANGSGSTSDEICVFCHTPHNATAAGFAPLWNRTTVNATNVYTGPGSLDATITTGSVNATDAPLCLSCHDGASLSQGLTNPPNAAPAAGTVTLTLNAAATMGTDMTNDHPVGFDYSGINALDTEIYDKATASGNGAQFFGTAGNDMWCSSCHDVHDNTNVPFLNVTNSASQLCLTCHNK